MDSSSRTTCIHVLRHKKDLEKIYFEEMILRPEQRIAVDKGKEILSQLNLLYLNCMPRTGKSLMSITIAKEMGWKKVGVVTKKIAIASIESDHEKSGYNLDLTVKNFERALELPKNCDGYIID